MTLLSAVAPHAETPVDLYLAEQADLTAVARFAQRHAAEVVPRQARYYRDLIPFGRPQPGQQYGFEVDLDACTGCKACVAACHSLNGLDEGESWRSVTVLSGGTAARPFQQTVTAACHHCVDPACLSGCPVDAYEKDAVTGIVSHLDDQCIGCGYCTLTCPYEVPVLNQARGIVRKCDMCQGRLAVGEAPACVQACPNGAIAIRVIDTAVAVEAAARTRVPGGPPSTITVPATVYRTSKAGLLGGAQLDEAGLDDAPARPAPPGWERAHPPRPARAHPPLAVMLVLTQLAVGSFVTDIVVRSAAGHGSGSFDATLAVAAGALALGASILHLGRPRYCYRAVIGLRHSWLSREVVAFGAFTALAALHASLTLLRGRADGVGLAALAGATAVVGLAGVGCSVMIYALTHRQSWRPAVVTAKFLLTTAVCGLATVMWASLVPVLPAGGTPLATWRSLPWLLAGLTALKLTAETVWMRPPHPHLRDPQLRATTERRFAAGLAGGLILPLLLAATGGAAHATWPGAAVATLAVAGVVTGELLERSLFFTAATPPQ